MKRIPMVALILTVAICTNGQVKKYTVTKTDAEWHKQLTEQQFQVTRKENTERPYTGKYWNNHKNGVYKCICCGQSLFNADTKFESGTGWPSFWQPIINSNLEELPDYSYGDQITKVNCNRCGAHLGHVFDDGPRPTGLRYCINSASLFFVPKK